jgi:hypothetical protein
MSLSQRCPRGCWKEGGFECDQFGAELLCWVGWIVVDDSAQVAIQSVMYLELVGIGGSGTTGYVFVWGGESVYVGLKWEGDKMVGRGGAVWCASIAGRVCVRR